MIQRLWGGKTSDFITAPDSDDISSVEIIRSLTVTTARSLNEIATIQSVMPSPQLPGWKRGLRFSMGQKSGGEATPGAPAKAPRQGAGRNHARPVWDGYSN
jgi:hypothetical protein